MSIFQIKGFSTVSLAAFRGRDWKPIFSYVFV
jgi:hypothetical protein